jgi:hypothetical protein
MDPEDVQGTTPQGSEGGGLFDSYLQAVPEDGREIVANYLKDAEKNVNSRLQEAAEIQKQFGPYREVEALSQYNPQQLKDLLTWHSEVTSSDDSFKDWLTKAATELGVLTPQEEEELSGELTREQIQELIQEREQAAIAPLEQRIAEWEELRTIDTIESQIRDELSRVEADAKVQLSPEQRAMVIDLGLNHEGDDWVQAGFKRFQEITAEGQRTFVEQKTQQPGTPMSSGGQEAFKPTTDWGEAKAQALERMRQALTT